jgi:hypothetical protein
MEHIRAMFHLTFPHAKPSISTDRAELFPAVTVVDLARAISGYSPNRSMILVLAAFFDDSGIHKSSPVVVMGGLLGTEEQWNEFAAAWSKLLYRPLPGKPSLINFHLSHCRAPEGEFREYSLSERDRVTYLFRKVILDTGLVTVATAINKTAWDELIVGDLVDELGQPLECCFYKCISSVIDIIRVRKPGQKVALIFDQGTREQLEMWARFFFTKKEKYPEIGSIGFGAVSEVLALQGADMIATETYQYGQQWLKDGENAIANAHFRDYLKRDLSVGLVLDREHIEEIVRRFRETKQTSI